MKYINSLTKEIFESKEPVKEVNVMPLRSFLEAAEFKPVETFWEGEI